MTTIITLVASVLLSFGCSEKKAADLKASPAAGFSDSTEIGTQKIKVFSAEKNDYIWVEKVHKTSAEWKKQLEPLLTEEQRRRSELGGKVDVPEVEATIRDLTGGAASPAAGAPDATGITRLDPSATSS